MVVKLSCEKLQEEIDFKPIQKSENKKVKSCQMFYWLSCVDCGTETFRRCDNKPLCIVCELTRFHKNWIHNVTHETHDSMNDSDQKKTVVIR